MILSSRKARLLASFKTRLIKCYFNSQLKTDPVYLRRKKKSVRASNLWTTEWSRSDTHSQESNSAPGGEEAAYLFHDYAYRLRATFC